MFTTVTVRVGFVTVGTAPSGSEMVKVAVMVPAGVPAGMGRLTV